MDDLLKRLPLWLIAILLFAIVGILAYGVQSGRQVSIWRLEIGPAVAERTGTDLNCPKTFDTLMETRQLTLMPWRFGRIDGQQITPSPADPLGFRFGPDGHVLGYNNPNERTWEVSGNQLTVLNEAGAVSTKYRQIRCYVTIELVGDERNGNIHVLSRPFP
jgi:hypothetical protein